MQRTTLALAGILLTLGFSACNQGDNAQTQSVGSDWVNEAPSPTASNPTPTSTASPSPTTTNVTDLYTGSADFAKYVQKFIDDATIQGIDATKGMSGPKLTIQLGSLSAWGSSTIGLCETGTNLRRVTFDPTFWNSVSETQRELLAHHELGHCVLYRAHRSDVLPSGIYASIMYPVILSSSMYTSNYDYYQNELFTYGTSASGGTAVDPNVSTVHVCGQEGG